jgi:hypothetical protein
MIYELHTNSRFLGQLGVSAYCFDDSNRTYASIRAGLRKIRPIFEQTEDGQLRQTSATTIEEDIGMGVTPLGASGFQCFFIPRSVVKLNGISADLSIDLGLILNCISLLDSAANSGSSNYLAHRFELHYNFPENIASFCHQ